MPREQSFQETIDYLYALQKQGIKLALSNSRVLMQRLGEPHRQFRSVHVAGTNGKGSTASFIAQMLMAGGYRVGLYTSPHLVSFTERIRINGVPVSEQKVVELAERVRTVCRQQDQSAREGHALNPTFFEVTTAMAFVYFAEERVDIAVVEVGMGGRFDSTNVIEPLVSVITNIDLEHTEYLGTTLEQIAGEKAGIIKPGVPVVTGVAQPEVIAVIEREAARCTTAVHRLGKGFSGIPVAQQPDLLFDYHGIRGDYGRLRIIMQGRYQIDNACLALAAVECLRGTGIDVPESAVRQGLEQTCWEGRLERVARKPDIYLDGAHNPASARQLAGAVLEMKPSYRRIILIIGILGDKDFEGIIRELVPLADHVVVTKPDYGRALGIQELTAVVRRIHSSVETAESVSRAISLGRDSASSDDLILITGSLYVVGDARVLFRSTEDTAGALSGLKG